MKKMVDPGQVFDDWLNRSRRMTHKVIAIGTGRCGSQSLVEWMNQQPGVSFTHHGGGLRWNPITGTYDSALESLKKHRGDFNPAWVNYIDRIQHPVKVLWLQRPNLDSVARSYYSYKRLALDYGVPLEPQFDQTVIQEREISLPAIRRSVERIWWLCEKVAEHYPTYVINMYDMNSWVHQEKLLKWMGMSEKEMKVCSFGFPHLNKRHDMINNVNEALRGALDGT